MVGLQVVMLGAPTSLTRIIMAGPHHAAVIHAGDSSEVGQREGPQESVGLSFCVLVAISPRRAKLGGFPLGMRSVGTPPPTPN
jgi:hypothetical protein